MVVYTLYFTIDVNLWLFGHSERPFSCRTSLPACRSAAVLVDRYPVDLGDPNINGCELQQLETMQGIVLMLSNAFFLIALVILASTAAFGRSPIACGRPGSGLLVGARSITSNFNTDRWQSCGAFQDILLMLPDLFLPIAFVV
jgi:hypothetical protein